MPVTYFFISTYQSEYCLCVFRERLSVCVCVSFVFGFEGRVWYLIVLVVIIAFLFTYSSLVKL